MTAFIAIIVLLLFALILTLFSRRGRRIDRPRLGLLDLTLGSSKGILEEDRDAIGDFFAVVEDSTTRTPNCDVLFLYAELGEDGMISGSNRTFRKTIRDSGATIVVLASENLNPRSVRRRLGEARANLVVTFDRRGDKFSRFFRELFARMKQGRSMSDAWVEIVPQESSTLHDDLPKTICLYEVGPIRFG